MPAFLTTADPTSGRSRWLVALFLTAAAGAALAVDLPLEKWILAGGLPRWLTKICSLSEIFAHGFGVLLVAAILVALDHERRAAVVRVLAAAFGAGLCANIVKLLVARARPHHFDFVGGVGETFTAILPLGHGGSGVQGFPSSHAATAAGLAVALAWLYPHGTRLFAALAGLACMQRLAAGAHFPSDVLAGSALGVAFGSQCVGRGMLARWFDRWEAARANRKTAPPTDNEMPTSAAA